MTIDALPPAPAATDSAEDFDTKAFAFNAALATFRSQANALGVDMQASADIVAAIALGLMLPNYTDTSASSLTIGTGSITFAVSTGKSWVAGQTIVASNGANYMKGVVTSYVGSTLVVNMTYAYGSGTFASWAIALTFGSLPLTDTTTINGYTLGYRDIPQNSQSAAYTFSLSDAGKHLLHPSADTTARTFTIPANAGVAFPVGTAITIVNQNAAGVLTIAITSDTLRLAGTATTGSRTLAANGMATLLKISATEWFISGIGLT